MSETYLFHSALRTACQLAGLVTADGKPTVTAHRFRHTVGTQLAEKGAKLRTIMSVLGHSSANMSLVYAQISDPEVLKEYAATHDADLDGWAFLTGAPADIREVARRYGVAVARPADGQVDHTLLTTLVDRDGAMRVQYLGYRFDPEEFRRDILSLLNEP